MTKNKLSEKDKERIRVKDYYPDLIQYLKENLAVDINCGRYSISITLALEGEPIYYSESDLATKYD